MFLVILACLRIQLPYFCTLLALFDQQSNNFFILFQMIMTSWDSLHTVSDRMMKWYVLQSKKKETTETYVFMYLIENLLVIPLNACKVTCCFNVKYHLCVVFCVVIPYSTATNSIGQKYNGPEHRYQ